MCKFHSEQASSTFSVFVSVLESLHQPERLIHRSSYWKVVHGDLPEDTFVVDDEESPEENFNHNLLSVLN